MGFVRRLSQQLHRLKSAVGRIETLQGEVASLRAESQARDAVLGEIRAVLYNVQQLSGESLTSINAFRSDGAHELNLARLALGRAEERQLRHAGDNGWRQNEFRVYSQFGEDGLIQFLVRVTGACATPFFVEFGVEDYAEANTRFLLMNNRWSGLVMDGSPENIAIVRGSEAYQRYDLRADAAFITRENIDSLLQRNGAPKDIGLLSIDIDGNDYWIWEAITAVDPVLVIVEYNYRFGAEASVVVPYDPAFVKAAAHPSAIYYGASLRALCRLADRKGFTLVGCSSGGVNAFFVRRDRLPDTLRAVSVEEGYVAGTHAEMRDAEGEVVKSTLIEQQTLLLALPLVHLDGENGT